jgi:hypothetical protein
MIETASNVSTLAERLRERITREGPIAFHDWMKAALYDPTEGYYCRSDRTRWGREGDYRTSPERSSLGILLQAYCKRLQRFSRKLLQRQLMLSTRSVRMRLYWQTSVCNASAIEFSSES